MPNGEVFDGRGEVFGEDGQAYYGRAHIHAVILGATPDASESARPDIETSGQSRSRITFLNATHFAVPFELVGRNVIVHLEDGRRLKAILADTHGAIHVMGVMRAE
mgnify:CR=1 FL=1